jgi:uncharacterized membrane protein (UPF0136 family)
MRKLLVVTLLINFALITLAFGVLGLLGAIFLFGLVYSVFNKFYPQKAEWGEKLAFVSTHILGVFAVAVYFQYPELTMMAIILEMIASILFLSLYRHK